MLCYLGTLFASKDDADSNLVIRILMSLAKCQGRNTNAFFGSASLSLKMELRLRGTGIED